MSDRTDLPKIKPAAEPSIFNHDAGKWGIIGGLLSIPISIAMTVSTKASEAFKNGVRASCLRGCKIKYCSLPLERSSWAWFGAEFLAKKKQEKEQTEGRVVKTPGYWNKGILSGMLVSSLIQLPLKFAETAGKIKPV